MKIIAITKTWRGHGFAVSSLRSIYPFMDKIIYVHSNKSWLGEELPNTVRPLVENPAEDPQHKIIHLTAKSDNQEDQYSQAYAEADKYEHDFKFLIDTDEVWDRQEILDAIDFAKNTPDADAFHAFMFTHFKSPLYQTTDFDGCMPVVLLRNGAKIRGIRGSQTTPKINIPNHLHHFCYVRNSLREVLTKIKTSNGVEKARAIDMKDWISEKWNKAPECTNALPIAGYESNLSRLRTVQASKLPEVMTDNAIVQSWERYLGIVTADKKEIAGIDDEIAKTLSAISGKTAEDKQQSIPELPEKAPDKEVEIVAGFVQEVLEARSYQVKGKALGGKITESAITEGETAVTMESLYPIQITSQKQFDSMRQFIAIKTRVYQNYQLSAFKTAVPRGMARVYELQVKLTMGNEPE